MSNRAVRVAWPALTILVATAALVAALVVQGDDGFSALRTGRPVARLVLVLAAAATIGLLATAAVEGSGPRRARLLDAAAAAAALLAAAAALTAFLLYAGDAPGIEQPGFGSGLVAFVLELDVGRAWLVATSAAALVSAVALAARSRRGAAVALVLAGLALVAIASQAAAPGDPLAVARTAVVSEALRFAGAATALGTVAVAATAGAAAPATAQRAARIGAAALVVALVGGASAALLRAGGSRALLLTDVGVLAVALLGALAAVERRPARLARAGRRLQAVALAAAAGIGAAPAITDPVPGAPAARTTPAEILTGEPLPAPLGVGTLLGSWRPDPLLLLVCGALLAGVAVTVGRARGAGTPVPAAPTASAVAGVLLLGWLTCGGLAVYAPLLLGAALVQHVGLLLVVPLLLAGGASASPLPRVTAWARASPLPVVRRLTDPRVATAVVVVVLLLVVGTPVLRWSVADPIGTELVDLLLLVCGALLMTAALGRPAGTPSRAPGAVVALLVVEIAGGVALLLGTGLLQADWFGAMGWGADARSAQRAGAASALLVAVPATLVLLGVVLRRRTRVPVPARSADPALVRPGGAKA